MARNEQLTFVIRARNLFAKTFDNARKKMRQLSAGAIRMGKRIAVGMAAAGAAVLALGRSFLRAWEIQARAEAKLAAVLKATGYAAGFTAGQLKKQAAQLQRMTGIGDEVILNSQAILATFKEIKGDQFKAATEAILDMSVVMGGASGSAASLESATVMIGKALNDPIRGLTSLRRVGVQLTKQQEEQIRAFAESGQIVKAQSVILGELKSQFGGAAAEGNATVRAMDLLKGTFGDLKENIGGAIANSEKFQGWMESIQATIDELSESGQLELWAEDVVFALDNIAASAKSATWGFRTMYQGIFLLAKTRSIMRENTGELTTAQKAASFTAPGRFALAMRGNPLGALDDAWREWDEKAEKDEVRRQQFRRDRAAKRQAQEIKEAQEMAAAQRMAARVEAGAVLDGQADAQKEIDAERDANARRTWEMPEMGEGEIREVLERTVAAHNAAEAEIAASLDAEAEAYAKAAKAAEVYLAAEKELPEGADPKSAAGWGDMKLWEQAAKAERRRREEMQKGIKPLESQRREAEKLLKALDDMHAERAIQIKLDADSTAFDAKIAGLEKEISDLLFLDQTDPREERAALFERKENAKRIAEETAKDEARFAELQERQRSRRHIGRRSREWMEQFQEGRGRMEEAAAKQAEIDALQRQVAQNTKDSADALKTIKTNLDTLLRAS